MIASSLIDLHALWQILVVGFAAGAGVVVAFGFVIFGVSRYEETGGGAAGRSGGLVVAALGGAFCLAALVLGFIAMTHK